MKKNKTILHSVVVVGILGWGIPMFTVMTLVPILRSRDSSMPGLLIGIPIWTMGGALFGFLMWLVQGRNQRADREILPDRRIPIPEGTYTITTNKQRNLFVVCALAFVGFLILEIAVRLWFGVIVFGFFLFLAVIVLPMYWGFIEVNRSRIRHSCGYGIFQIAWHEVTHVEVDPVESTFVFCGDGKRMPIPGPGSWTGAESEEFEAVIRGEIETRGLEIRPRRLAAYMLPWNVRITAAKDS